MCICVGIDTERGRKDEVQIHENFMIIELWSILIVNRIIKMPYN